MIPSPGCHKLYICELSCKHLFLLTYLYFMVYLFCLESFRPQASTVIKNYLNVWWLIFECSYRNFFFDLTLVFLVNF